MATKIPLVLNIAGDIEELQPGDEISDPSPDKVTYTTGEDIAAFDAVYLSAADTVMKAKANSAATMPAIGVALSAVLSGNPIEVQIKGLITGMTGLTAKAKYYVSEATAGLLTATAPTGSGEFVQHIGIAKSTTALILNIKRPIKRA